MELRIQITRKFLFVYIFFNFSLIIDVFSNWSKKIIWNNSAHFSIPFITKSHLTKVGCPETNYDGSSGDGSIAVGLRI